MESVLQRLVEGTSFVYPFSIGPGRTVAFPSVWQLQQLCRLFYIEVIAVWTTEDSFDSDYDSLLLLWYHSLSSDIFHIFLEGSSIQRVAWVEVESSFGKVNKTCVSQIGLFSYGSVW